MQCFEENSELAGVDVTERFWTLVDLEQAASQSENNSDWFPGSFMIFSLSSVPHLSDFHVNPHNASPQKQR